jgi:NAD(P)-dependent dehydrogenase (short-subunit alcohol dehydrogenase family)
MSYLTKLFNLKNKVVVVTGAKGQLGAVICKAYKEAGAKVIGLDLDVKNKRVKGIEYYPVDITKKEDIKKLFVKIAEKYKAFDVLINNAGVSVFEPFEDRTEEGFDWVVDVNLKGTFFCTQAYVNLCNKRRFKKGCVINIASIFGMVSPDYRNYTDCKRISSEVYGATKAGIIQMTRYFATHLAKRNIRVNAVSPGGIFNPSNPQGKDFIKNYSFRCPMGRMARDHEMIGAIFYLSSDAASYVTGQNLLIDGGMSCW